MAKISRLSRYRCAFYKTNFKTRKNGRSILRVFSLKSSDNDDFFKNLFSHSISVLCICSAQKVIAINCEMMYHNNILCFGHIIPFLAYARSMKSELK